MLRINRQHYLMSPGARRGAVNHLNSQPHMSDHTQTRLCELQQSKILTWLFSFTNTAHCASTAYAGLSVINRGSTKAQTPIREPAASLKSQAISLPPFQPSELSELRSLFAVHAALGQWDDPEEVAGRVARSGV